MEAIKKIMEQLPNRYSEQSTSISRLKDFQSSGEISLYSGGLTAPIVVANVAKLKEAFPTLPEGFYKTLTERIVENQFSDERLTDAVKYVIDTCVYPQPSIANFISYDKTIKYKSWIEMTKEGQWDTYKAVKFPENPLPVWIHVNDIARYNLTKYLVK